MKRFVYLSVLFAAISCFLFSCKAVYIQEGTTRIETLQKELSTAAATLMSIDTVHAKSIYNEHLNTLDKIKKMNYTEKESEEWNILHSYGQVKKPIRQFLTMAPDFYTEVRVSEKQLQDLLYDLKKKNITQEQFLDYIAREEEAIRQLSFQVEAVVLNAKEQMAAFESLQPEILEIIEKHKK